MDRPSRHSIAAVSPSRFRLKTVILTVAGISVGILGAVGYLAYNKIKENKISSEEPSMVIQSTPSHQTPTLSSQSPNMTSTSSTITVATKQSLTLSASTNPLSTSSASLESLSSGTETTESVLSSTAVVTTKRTTQVTLLTSCESESSTNLTGTSPLDCSRIEPCNSGVFYVFPYEEGNDSVPVYCGCYGEGEMWTVNQKRFDGSVDFNRNWTDYKNGFGDACGEYWLGNEGIHQLTTKKKFKLMIVMTGWNHFTKWALYDAFSLADEANGYRLKLGSYFGNTGDSMAVHNNSKFSAKNRDDDANPTIFNHAVRYSGAWWYGDGLQSNLNGLYYNSSKNPDHDGIIWSSAFGNDSLKETTMMIKQSDD